MAFIEHSINIYDAALTKFHDFFVNTLGLIPDDEDPAMVWCDETKTIGIKGLIGSGSKINLDIYTNSGETSYSLSGSFGDSSYDTYWQMSKDKDVKYVRGTGSTSAVIARLLIAKSDNGDWCIFAGDYMYHKNGRMSIGSPDVSSYSNTPFSASKMPDLAAGGSFPNLYKMLTSTVFSLAGTYVNFNGDPYRIVYAGTSSSANSIAGNYAFPVADEA